MNALAVVLHRIRDFQEQRRAHREFADGMVVLVRSKPAGDISNGRIANVSREGMQIVHRMPFSQGDRLTVVSPDHEVPVEVMWTSEIPEGFCSGMQVVHANAADRMTRLRESLAHSAPYS